MRGQEGTTHQQAPERPSRAREESHHPRGTNESRLAGLQRPPRRLSGEVRLWRSLDREGSRGGDSVVRDRETALPGGTPMNPPKVGRAIDALKGLFAREPLVRSAVL